MTVARGRVQVYDPTGVTLLGTLTKRRGIKVRDPLHLPCGTLDVQVHPSDPALVANPNLLAHLNVLKFGVDYGAGFVDRAGFRIEADSQKLVSSGERVDEWRTMKCRDLRSILDDAEVYPELPLSRYTGDERWFGFMSAAGDWYVPSQWVAPGTAVPGTYAHGVHLGGYPEGYPAGWPDAASRLMWAGDPNATGADGVYREVLARATFTLPTAKNVRIYVTADDFYELYIDGELVSLQDSRLYQWLETGKVEMTLTAGSHLIAIKSWDSINTVSWFMLCISEVNAGGFPTQTLFRTESGAGWLVHAVQPGNGYVGWRGDQMLRQLVTEAQGRGISPVDALTVDFTNALDSGGAAWTGGLQDRKFPVGTSLLEALDELTELSMDVAVTPAMQLRAWNQRGTNKTLTVQFLPGVNLLEHTLSTSRARKTRLLIRTLDGWSEQANAAQETALGRLEGFLSVGSTTSPNHGLIVGAASLAELAFPRSVLTSEVALVTGALPYVDFDLGDLVRTTGRAGAALDVTVVAHNWAEGDNGLLSYVPEWVL